MSISWLQYFLYLKYIVVGIGMTIAYGAAYIRITPVRELILIKQGNLACALSLSGTLIGFCTALATSIARNVYFIDFILWAMLAAIIQLMVYATAIRIIPDAAAELENNNTAVGIFFFALSVSIGLLNAACLS